mgnify:FL=1
MANETELANIGHPTDVISDAISAALVQKVVALPLIYTEDVAEGASNVKLARKAGNLVAEELAESTAYSFSASSEYTESEVTSTATKFVCVSKLTIEAQKFSSVTKEKIMMEQAAAIGRDLDDEILALTSGFSNQVTATSTLTVDDVQQAVYTVRSGTAGVSSGMLAALLDYKGVNELIKEINSSTGTIYSQAQHSTLLGGVIAENGFAGTLPGVALYNTDGLPTSGGDDVGLVFDPALAIFGQMSSSIETRELPNMTGFWDEISSAIFADFVEWNDAAGCGLLSDT